MNRPSALIRRGIGPVFVLAALTACSDSPVEPGPTPQAEVAVVVNSIDRSLTVFDTDDPQASFTVGLGPDGSPVNVAVRGTLAVVPMGYVPTAVVVDLVARSVVHTVALPEGSGATGAAFVNDSIVLVANPGRNTVSPVNVLRGTAGDEIEVGGYPQAIVAAGDTAWVLNAELGPDFLPAGPGTVTLIAGSPPGVIETITLSGMNPSAAVAWGGRIYVVNSGSFGAADGSLSVLDRGTLSESAHETGFGDFPGALGVGPEGLVHVGSFSYGIAVWDPVGGFVRAPDSAIAPGGTPATAGLGFDYDGRLYSLEPECVEPARVFRLDAAYEVEAEIPAGICPIGIAFTTLPTADP